MDVDLEVLPSGKAGKAGRLMTSEEKERIRTAIANATSSEEIKRLERNLREGFVPE